MNDKSVATDYNNPNSAMITELNNILNNNYTTTIPGRHGPDRVAPNGKTVPGKYIPERVTYHPGRMIADLKALGLEIEVTHDRERYDKFEDFQSFRRVIEGSGAKMTRALEDWFHENNFNTFATGTIFSPTGGITEVKVTTKLGNFCFGLAHCSMMDNYCRSKGALIALRRAVAEMVEDLKKERRVL